MTTNANLVSLGELLASNRLFDIPVYQRSYAWEKNNLEDLWEDLYHLDKLKNHFFGTLLLEDSGDTTRVLGTNFNRTNIVDGQQRVTTVVILLREIISMMKESEDDELQNAVSHQERSYLKIAEFYKLNPLADDANFFHKYVIDNNEFPKETQTTAQRRMANAKRFFRDKLIEQQENLNSSEFDEFLMELKEKIDELQVLRYLVTSRADAVRIFETANDRGKSLSNLEKTKSFLMHTSYENRLEDLNTCFSSIYRYIDDVNDSDKNKGAGRLGEDEIQRYHFINYVYPDSTRSASTNYVDELKNLLRDKLRRDSGEASQYVLDYAIDIERAFLSVKQIFELADKDDRLGTTMNKIFIIGRRANIFPLLIASWIRFGKQPDQMEQILNLLEAFTFRTYAVVRRRADSGVARFNSLAHDVHKGRLDYKGLVSEIKKISNEYGNVRMFEESLRSENFYSGHTRSDIKYLLSEYEIYLAQEAKEPLEAQSDILSDKYQVEHIWAQNPADGDSYGEDTKQQHQQNVHKLGNLTIASAQWNKQYGNLPFAEKKHGGGNRPGYDSSSLRVQRDLAAYDAWNDDAIKRREDKLVAFALQRWEV